MWETCTIRSLLLGLVLAPGIAAVPATPASAQRWVAVQQPGPPPAANSLVPGPRNYPAGNVRPMTPNPARGRVTGEHLGVWMQEHRNLDPQSQRRALQNEPGFNQLPPQAQQRVMDRLNRLNSLPERQRERVIARGEAFERMSPDERAQVRGAMGQLSALPDDRRRMVARTFRELRAMPVPDRNMLLNSPAYRQQFTDEERGTLGNLLAVSPLLPQNR
jgi:hypothetical protein